MCYKTFDKAERKYQLEVEHLNVVAHHVWDGNHGSFVRKMADAWLHADNSNQRILKTAWEAIVVKYSLAEEAEN